MLLNVFYVFSGRGTLCHDILKVFSHFKALHKATLALVEVSPMMSDLQAKKLCTNSDFCSEQSLIYRKGKHFDIISCLFPLLLFVLLCLLTT